MLNSIFRNRVLLLNGYPLSPLVHQSRMTTTGFVPRRRDFLYLMVKAARTVKNRDGKVLKVICAITKSTLGFPRSLSASSITKEEVRSGEIVETNHLRLARLCPVQSSSVQSS